MSNCKAFGPLRARNHAIGQTPRGVLAPRFQNEFQGSAAFSIRDKAASARHRSDAGEHTRTTPTRHRSDAGEYTRTTPTRRSQSDQVRPTTSTKSARRVEPESTPSNRNTPCPITVLWRRSRHSQSRHSQSRRSQSRRSRSQHTGLAADDFVHRRPQHNHQKAPRIYRHSK